MFDTIVTLTVSAAFVASLATFAGFALVRNVSGRRASRLAPWAASALSATKFYDTSHPTALPDGVRLPETHRS